MTSAPAAAVGQLLSFRQTGTRIEEFAFALLE